MDKVYIDKKLNNIFKSYFNLNMSEESLQNENLLGLRINLKPNELIHLFFMIEDEFEIVIPSEEIINGNFSTYNKILNIINNAKYLEFV